MADPDFHAPLPGGSTLMLLPLSPDFDVDTLAADMASRPCGAVLSHTRAWLDQPDRLTDDAAGEVLVMVDATIGVVGITGWYPVPGASSMVGLRWHGALPRHRRKGIAQLGLRLVATRLRHLDLKPPPEFVFEAPVTAKAANWFRRIGFTDAPDDILPACLEAAEMPKGVRLLTIPLLELAIRPIEWGTLYTSFELADAFLALIEPFVNATEKQALDDCLRQSARLTPNGNCWELEVVIESVFPVTRLPLGRSAAAAVRWASTVPIGSYFQVRDALAAAPAIEERTRRLEAIDFFQGRTSEREARTNMGEFGGRWEWSA
ncbi:MAG: hypothetical protein WCF85_15555 [Rhodospirillaceae bacterium]